MQCRFAVTPCFPSSWWKEIRRRRPLEDPRQNLGPAAAYELLVQKRARAPLQMKCSNYTQTWRHKISAALERQCGSLIHANLQQAASTFRAAAAPLNMQRGPPIQGQQPPHAVFRPTNSSESANRNKVRRCWFPRLAWRRPHQAVLSHTNYTFWLSDNAITGKKR